MENDRAHTAVSNMLDDLYSDQDVVSRGRIFERAEREPLDGPLTFFFSMLPPGDYTRQELVNEINGMIVGQDRETDVGLIH